MITLAVRDLERSVRFYGEGLGLPRYGGVEEIAFFNLKGTWLGLYGWDELAEDVGIDPGGTGFRGVTLSHNLASEAEVDELMAAARAAGAEVLKPPQKVFWGGYSGYFRDPDRHLWELAHNPFTWIGPPDGP